MINERVNIGFQPRLETPVIKGATDGVTAPAATTVDAQDTPPAQPAAPTTDQLQNAVSKLNEYVQSYQRKLSFSVSAETGRTIIKVYDAETEELIRQIPPEETVKLAETLDTQSSGLFVKERA